MKVWLLWVRYNKNNDRDYPTGTVLDGVFATAEAAVERGDRVAADYNQNGWSIVEGWDVREFDVQGA